MDSKKLLFLVAILLIAVAGCQPEGGHSHGDGDHSHDADQDHAATEEHAEGDDHGHDHGDGDHSHEPTTPPRMARTQLQSASGVSGTVTFLQVGDEVTVEAVISGATPGEHGFHLHEKGDCSSADYKSAGGHFNPSGADHAGPDSDAHHAGDFGNITIGEDGTGRLELVSTMLKLDDGDHGVVGRAIIFHEKADDMNSQPSGAAGPRLACGIVALIGVGESE